jgi:hypothetical protein
MEGSVEGVNETASDENHERVSLGVAKFIGKSN